MPCYKPLFARKLEYADGSVKIIFPKRLGYLYAREGRKLHDDDLLLPCGRCVGCRLERSRQWAVRCMHEASLHKNNEFITLTYNDDYLPSDKSLKMKDFQLFMKRLRKSFGVGVRFFHCGEYGEKYGRPHYHACLFNCYFNDKRLLKIDNGNRIYTSAKLENLWPYGFSTVGDVTFQSAAYVARYLMKKVTGPTAEAHYNGKLPEYTTMSRKPGIGKGWLDKYVTDVYPHDYVVVNGKKGKPPRYYDGQYEIIDPNAYQDLKENRRLRGLEKSFESSFERLQVKEYIKKDTIKKLYRKLDAEL